MTKKATPLKHTDEKTDNEAPSHQIVDKLSTQTETANAMKFRTSCEQHYLAQERSKKVLSCMCYGIDMNGVYFDIENIEVCMKFPAFE